MIWILWGLLAIGIAEIGLVIVVRKARTIFPWIITEKDEVPRLDKVALDKFVATSFDPRLGWVRKPNSSGIERGKIGNIRFEIDASGSRATVPLTKAPIVAAFGDSYAFCRQVEDGETWEAHLARAIESPVLNYGVGNYGVDQALLRYEGMQLPGTVRFVVMGFVPETICRVHSYWKHYLEFGNTFAFKPRFVLGPERQLSLLENVMQKAGDFADIRSVLPLVQKHDFFYLRKFRALQFRFPYLLRFVLHPRRQGKLLAAVAWRGFLRLCSRVSEKSENMPFTTVMRENIRNAHSLYRDERAKALLMEILLRFKKVAKNRGQEPLIVLMPQLLDIKLIGSNPPPYELFYRLIGEHVPVLDLTQVFNQHKTEDLYINDQYGGHLSSFGNLIVAQEIATWMDTLKMDSERGDK